MTYKEERAFLVEHHLGEWINERRKVSDEYADKLGMFCVCGSLLTGLHMSRCSRFSTFVDKETVLRLAHLIKNR